MRRALVGLLIMSVGLVGGCASPPASGYVAVTYYNFQKQAFMVMWRGTDSEGESRYFWTRVANLELFRECDPGDRFVDVDGDAHCEEP